MNDKLIDLECRIFDLEFAAFKKRFAAKGISTTKRATRSTPKSSANLNHGLNISDDWVLHSHSHNGKKQFRVESGGAFKDLPEDRELWPEDIRESFSKFEEFDKGRQVGRHLVSNMKKSPRLT